MHEMIIKILFFTIVAWFHVYSSSTPAGTAITRRPVLQQPSPIVIATPTLTTSNIKKPPVTTTIEEDTSLVGEDGEPQPTVVKPSKPTAEPDTSNALSPSDNTNQVASSMDPTDYATVWPTRWRPRRRFGAQSDAQTDFKVDWMLLILLSGGLFGLLL